MEQDNHILPYVLPKVVAVCTDPASASLPFVAVAAAVAAAAAALVVMVVVTVVASSSSQGHTDDSILVYTAVTCYFWKLICFAL